MRALDERRDTSADVDGSNASIDRLLPHEVAAGSFSAIRRSAAKHMGGGSCVAALAIMNR